MFYIIRISSYMLTLAYNLYVHVQVYIQVVGIIHAFDYFPFFIVRTTHYSEIIVYLNLGDAIMSIISKQSS